jgi:prephenate dehydrogenase
MKVSIIGLGLIGSSIAKDLRKNNFANKIIGVEKDTKHAHDALQLGIVDEINQLTEAVFDADLVVVSVPVDKIVTILPQILDVIGKQTTVTDVGSTKVSIVEAVLQHPNRSQYVAAHPMSGTENSGPQAALEGLFCNKTTIICDKDFSASIHLVKVEKMYHALGSRLAYMSADDHDHNTAFVSHLPHVTAFALANSVLQKEDRQVIVELAGGGFRDASRLAKSSPEMWTPIFQQNKHYLLEAIAEYSKHLQQMQQAIADDRWDVVFEQIKFSNKLRDILKKD